ncbi:MAG: hypothetical protein R3C12_01015 [Planctomycetaceae bacterium]
MTQFINETADLFEPETEAARVGFECHFDEAAWRVHFYLGDAEHFGGMLDGKRQRIAFDFDSSNCSIASVSVELAKSHSFRGRG